MDQSRLRTGEKLTSATLGDLYRDGRLLAEYPRVRRLLADLPEEELGRAGRTLSRLDPDDVQREHPGIRAVSVAITGHGTVSTLVAPLTAEFARHGLLLRPMVANFDSYVFDLGNPESTLYAAGPELTLCVLDPGIVFDEVPVPWSPADVENVMAAKLSLIERLARSFHDTSRGTLVMNTMPLLRRYTGQLLDHRSRARLGAVWREGNARLLRLGSEIGSLVIVDLDPLIADGTVASDSRLSSYAKVHLSPGLLARYAREIGHLARHLTGGTKKVLALDLDGTTWGGVLGDDGAEGIEVADSYRGEAFRAFQRVAKQISAQGILLTAVSKNNPEPVREVLRGHPRMTLTEDDFVRVTANWRPKHENLTELAGLLNVAVESIVFVDDSAHECGLVSHYLPEVAVVRVDDEPALHAEKLLRDGWFDVMELTAEDRGRVVKYQEDLARKDFLDSFSSVDDYLRELKISVRLSEAAESDVVRAAQLSLRTNQFNMTTRRLQPGEVAGLIADPAALVLTIRASDRFGDNGLVGVIFARREANAVHIDNFVLSCRVFSRGIEQACLAAVLRHARATHAEAVFGEYSPTSKNGMVSDFYSRYGFAVIAAEGTMVRFRHDLADIIPHQEHIDLSESLGKETSWSRLTASST
jgi:FkbH-like protein